MWRGRTLAAAIPALLVVVSAAGALTAAAAAEQASQPSSSIAGTIAAGGHHSCAVLPDQSLRCWGYGGDGALGYGNRLTIGDDEAPAAAGPVDLGPLHAVAVGAGAVHTCALLEDAAVRCWGFGGDGRLGYGNGASIGDDETPVSVQPIQLGSGRSATAITAGGAHTCAVLDGGAVRCWGFGLDGRLGYGNADSVGDDETPAAAGPVDLGAGRAAVAISAGDSHTCAVLDDGSVRCWGEGANGQLGHGSIERVGDDETPAAAGPVGIGAGRAAAAISAGDSHTCAVLDDGSVRCWGYGGNGRLGYGNRASVGDTDTPASAGPVDLGTGRTARAITAGGNHTCALLDDGTVRCWGYGGSGALGYGNPMSIGDDETPGAVGPVDLGPGRTALAIAAGGEHTCAVLDDRTVRCWGAGAHGRLGYCNERDIGDDESPGSAGPVNVSRAVFCPAAAPPAPAPAAPAPAAPALAAPPAPAAAGLFTAKLSLARARIVRRERVLDVLAPITSMASGSARVQLHAAGLIYSFRAQINERDGRIRFRKLIPKPQAQLATGIITITYPGDADTRPQTVRLRAALQRADLRLQRPTIAANGRLRASGTVSKRARGVVRVQLEYVADDKTTTLQFLARISNGRWSLNERLSQTVRNAIARRSGTVHSYTLFTGYLPARMRGEMRSFQVLGPR